MLNMSPGFLDCGLKPSYPLDDGWPDVILQYNTQHMFSFLLQEIQGVKRIFLGYMH
jgi:hypothetical protein